MNQEFKVLLKEHYIQDITCMHFLLVCKFKKFISNREKVETLIFRHSRADNFVVSRWIWQKFKVIQAFIVLLVTCNNENDPLKDEGTRVDTTFLPL